MKIKLLYTPAGIRFQPQPPLGIATLTSILRKNGHYVEQEDLELKCYVHNKRVGNSTKRIDLELITDFLRVDKHVKENTTYFDMEKTFDNLYNLVKLDDFGAVGFSIMSLRQFATALLFAKRLHKEKMHIKIIFGGVFTRENALKMLEKYDFIDFVLVGQAYKSLPRLIDKIQSRNNKEQIAEIPGLCHRKGARITINKEESENIDHMPAPDYNGLPLSTYVEVMDTVYEIDFNFSILKYILSLGCPYRCTFCNRCLLEKFQLKSPTKVVEELKSLSKKYGTTLFSFECELINSSRHWLIELCDYLLRDKLELKWYAFGRPANLSKDLLQRLYLAGCRVLRWGVESGSQRILDRMNKKFSVRQVEQILKWSSDVGIWNHVNLIIGHINENVIDTERTVNFIKKNKGNIDSIKMSPFYINIDSAIMQDPVNYGIKITKFGLDCIEYDQIDGENWESIRRTTSSSINKICSAALENGISFVGAILDILFPALVYFQNKEEAKNWLKEKHPYFFEGFPTQILIQKLYHPEKTPTSPSSLLWKSFIGRWGGANDILC